MNHRDNAPKWLGIIMDHHGATFYDEVQPDGLPVVMVPERPGSSQYDPKKVTRNMKEDAEKLANGGSPPMRGAFDFPEIKPKRGLGKPGPRKGLSR